MVLDSEIDANAISKLLLASATITKKSMITVDGEDDVNDLPTKITDRVLRNLYEMKKDVKSLNLSSCDAITDLGFVALGKYWPNLEAIWLGGCSQITVVGLRSLALNCRKLRSICFVGYEIDDAGLRIIAASLVVLESIDLTGCQKVTDRGLSEIAHCCTKLKSMKLGGCYKLGESGIWAFCEVGNSCVNLEEIDLSDVTYLSDNGLLVVAKRCTLLKKIHISRCPYISSRAITKVFGYASNLVDFAASESCSTLNYDEVTTIVKACAERLLRLDLSFCENIQLKEVEMICHCSKLLDLKLSECKIDDKAIMTIAKDLTALTSLEIFNCKLVSEKMIHKLRPKENGTGISYLGLTGCTQIRKEFLSDEATQFRFSNLVVNENCVAYYPRESEMELRKEARIAYDRRLASTCIQRMVRGNLVRSGIIRKKREEKAVSLGIPRLQAIIRGGRQRALTIELRRRRMEQRAVSTIEHAFQYFVSSKIYHQEVEVQKAKRKRTKAIRLLQGYYRKHSIRVSMHQMALENARKVLKLRQKDAMERKAAVLIQCFARTKLSQMQLSRLQRDEANKRALLHRRLSSIHTVQCAVRGYLGRSKTCRIRKEVREVELKWRSARSIQCFWRVTKSKGELEQRRYFKRLEVHAASALRIQSFWRGKVGRDKYHVLFSLYELKRREWNATLLIQRAYRGMLGRKCAEKIRSIAAQEGRKESASITVQKIYRGFIGRESAYVRAQLKSIESKADSIYQDLQVKVTAISASEEDVEKCQCEIKEQSTSICFLKNELRDVTKSNKRFVDTTVVNGVKQRVASSIVMSTLNEKIDKGEKDLLRLTDTERRLRDKLRDLRIEKKRMNDHLLEVTSRAEAKIKNDRRKKIRSLIKIQAGTDVNSVGGLRNNY